MPSIASSFIEGEDSERFLVDHNKDADEKYQGNKNLKVLSYNEGIAKGSNIFAVARIDTKLREQGLRTATLQDLGNETILDMIREKYYVDAPVLVLRSLKDRLNPRNNNLAEKLAEYIDVSKIEKTPALITGFDVASWPEDSENYGLQFTPRGDFSVSYDDRLLAKYNQEEFSKTDELGLPIFDKKGIRTWYTREDGLSRLVLGRDFGLYSDFDYLADSGEYGRVVVVSGGAASQNFSGLENYISRLQIEKSKQIEGIENKYKEALRILKGN